MLADVLAIDGHFKVQNIILSLMRAGVMVHLGMLSMMTGEAVLWVAGVLSLG